MSMLNADTLAFDLLSELFVWPCPWLAVVPIFLIFRLLFQRDALIVGPCLRFTILLISSLSFAVSAGPGSSAHRALNLWLAVSSISHLFVPLFRRHNKLCAYPPPVFFEAFSLPALGLAQRRSHAGHLMILWHTVVMHLYKINNKPSVSFCWFSEWFSVHCFSTQIFQCMCSLCTMRSMYKCVCPLPISYNSICYKD